MFTLDAELTQVVIQVLVLRHPPLGTGQLWVTVILPHWRAAPG